MSVPANKRKVSGVGNYRFTGTTLGKGNFARVEEAVHSLLNIKVAIKVMDVNHIKEDYVIRNLSREAKIMSRLNHPCIVALFQTMQRSDNIYYLVTELVSGGDLCTFVKSQQDGRLEEKPTRMYGRQFASALSHMHGLGIVHRDLKMENVMLNPTRQQIKIVDFGLSNVWSASNPLRTHCGSPEYAAPELFVTGKQYGAEVDLWSLGIILYGMVLGQLPFVTNRSGQVTSQERRKKLVAQINRGLSSTHRRALSTFSSEFRSLMNRLLVADATKRITVKELIVHPWVTERGKKMIRSNPLKNLDAAWKNKVFTEISTLLQIDPNVIAAAVSKDPLGKIGGVYNILQRRHQMSQLTGDGVTRVLPSLTLLELADIAKNIDKEKKIYTARSVSQKKPQSAMINRKNDYCTPRIIELDRTLKPVMSSPNEQIVKNKLQQQNKTKKKDQLLQKARPNTVQPTSNHQKNRPPLDYRAIKSPSLRRKAYSATITPKTNRTCSPAGEGVAKNRPPDEVKDREEASRTREAMKAAEKMPRPKKDMMELLHMNGMRKHGLSLGSKLLGTQQSREDHPKVRHTAPENVRCKTEQSHNRRPTGALQQILENTLKNAGVTMSQSNHKAAEILQKGDPRCSHHRKPYASNRHWERSPLAFGDTTSRAVTAPLPQTRKPAIYDPIAKSIADYVANNVPEKLHHFPWFKK